MSFVVTMYLHATTCLAQFILTIFMLWFAFEIWHLGLHRCILHFRAPHNPFLSIIGESTPAFYRVSPLLGNKTNWSKSDLCNFLEKCHFLYFEKCIISIFFSLWPKFAKCFIYMKQNSYCNILIDKLYRCKIRHIYKHKINMKI